MITSAQVDTQIDAAWAAIQVNEKSYTVHGRTLVFNTLDEMQRHINWLLELRQSLLGQADAASGDAICPTVEYQNSE